MNNNNSNIILKIIIPVLLCLCFFIIAATGIKDKTHTTDEPSHLIRGVMLLKTGDYRLNQHHPILANVLQGIPAVLNEDLKTQELDEEEWRYAKKDAMAWNLVVLNGGEIEFAQNILYQSRLVTILLSTFFIFIFYQIVFKLFGAFPAIVSTLLLSINPTFIAHSSLVTTDAPVTATIFLNTISALLFIKYFNDVKKRKMFLCLFILISFLSILTKYTAIVPFIVLTFFILIYSFLKEKNFLYTTKIFFVILLSVFLLAFASYSFRTGTLQDAAYNNVSKIEDDYKQIDFLPLSIQKPVIHFYENVPIPMHEYVRGFYENVVKHSIYGHRSFFMGDFSDIGRWNYFPVAFAIKEPISLVLLTVFSVSFAIMYFFKKRSIKPEITVLIIVPLVLTVLSLTSTLNLGIRHILPIYPFIFLMIGLVLNHFYQKKPKVTIFTTTILFVFMFFSVLNSYPHYIEYFNELIGSKQNGYKYLRDSNLDWGQNKYFVEKYRKTYPEEKYDIISVEKLFGNPETISQEMIELQKMYKREELEIVDYVSNTHWIIKRVD